MLADIEKTCTECGTAFWWTAAEQEYAEELGVSVSAVRCPDCRRKKNGKKTRRRSKKESTALVPVAPPQLPQLVSQAMPDEASFVQELRELVHEAHTDYAPREATFFESIFDTGKPQFEEFCRKENAKAQVRQLLAREKAMLKGLQGVEVARADAETAIVRSRTELLEAKLEQLQLQERFRRTLLREANVKPEAALPTVQDLASIKEELETRQLQDKYRRGLRQRASADQVAISEFLDQVRQVFNHPQYEQSERATRIRSLMDSFGKGLEDLPAELRRFLNRFESEGDE